jgi:predicted HTH domain antitoxin
MDNKSERVSGLPLDETSSEITPPHPDEIESPAARVINRIEYDKLIAESVRIAKEEAKLIGGSEENQTRYVNAVELLSRKKLDIEQERVLEIANAKLEEMTAIVRDEIAKINAEYDLKQTEQQSPAADMFDVLPPPTESEDKPQE